MQVLRHQDDLEIILFQPEAYLLLQSLKEIGHHYQIDPENLPPTIKELWYSNSLEMDDEDYEIWVEHLREFRGENTQLIDRLVDDLQDIDSWPVLLKVTFQEADRLITVINDHRLYLAAASNVGELEMNEDWEEIFKSPEKHAVVKIHFLAWLIELVIMRLNPTEEF